MSICVARFSEKPSMLLLLLRVELYRLEVRPCWWQNHTAVQLGPFLHCCRFEFLTT